MQYSICIQFLLPCGVPAFEAGILKAADAAGYSNKTSFMHYYVIFIDKGLKNRMNVVC